MDSLVFTDTYLPLSEQVYRVAYHILENRTDAEDAVQDLYIRLWNSRDTLDAVHNPKAYCITMIRNICLDRIRKESKIRTTELSDAAGCTSEPDERLFGRESLKDVMKAMEKLSPMQKEVLRMKVFEDMSYEQMAGKTGMSKLTLRVLMSQARSRLKKAI